jgi:hypothetical protein
MEFKQFYNIQEDDRNENDNWRLRYVWHMTKTGKRNKVRVKSLPKDEQWKYAPLEVKIKRQQKFGDTNVKTPTSVSSILTKSSRSFTVYYSANRTGGYNSFKKNYLVMVTDDSAKAIEIEKSGRKVAVAHQVPIEAFIKYWDINKKKWVKFKKDMDTEKKLTYDIVNDAIDIVDLFKNDSKRIKTTNWK